jgi:hypothetical protein
MNMPLLAFQNDPWKTSHSAYDRSAFNIRPAPEYANSEVVLSSLYRNIGFAKHPESVVPKHGKDFEKKSREGAVTTQISAGAWLAVLNGMLESPKLPNQSNRRFLQLTPIVPDAALYSGSARTTGNSWNPGLLIQKMVFFGAKSSSEANLIWRALFDALSVGDEDDIWARWLAAEFKARKSDLPDWEYVSPAASPDFPADDKLSLECPARQFVRDLRAVIAAKNMMTRRQWLTLLESILRLGSVMHVLWLCDVNDRLWNLVKSVIAGQIVPDVTAISNEILSDTTSYLSYGNPSAPIIRDAASRYLGARLGLNLALWMLSETGVDVDPLSSMKGIHKLLASIRKQREQGELKDFDERLYALRDSQARFLACKKGIGSNLIEFAQHVLGQRRTLNETLRGYDQGYFLAKRAQYLAAPWVLALGPVAILALTHCCLSEVSGPRSIERLCLHLAKYGLSVDRDDVAKSDLGQKLRMLGLVLDSPDAESGMLLIPPFAASSVRSATQP